MKRIRLRFFYISVLFLGWFTSCILIAGCTPEKNADSESHSKNIGHIQFADSVHAEYAEGFQITYHENYKLLEILKPFQDRVDTLRYSLVPRDIANEVEVKNTTEIPIPITSLLTTSTTHIGLAEMLNATDILIGMVGADYVYSKDIRNRLEEGKMISLPQGELNKEKILSMDPDLLMLSGGQSSQFDNVKILMDSDVDVMINSEWLETTPLGKAEWVKVLAALLNKEQLANDKFNTVAKEYNRLKSKVSDIQDKPLVINNMPYKGAWFVSGGESFTAQFLRDAGADYPWFGSDETGGLRKSFEVIYEIGLEADIWINPGAANSKEDILAKDSRFKDFKPFQSGEIYNNNKRMSPSGGNDFWESGVVHPEIILADLIKIFHPQQLPNHRLYYYQKVK